jgi:hypothetical protein
MKNTFEVCLTFLAIGIDWNHQANVKVHHGPLVHASFDLLDGNDDHADREVFAHELYQLNGMCFHLLRDNMYTVYHHRTEIGICLKNEKISYFFF